MQKILISIVLFFLCIVNNFGQSDIDTSQYDIVDYTRQKEYVIAEIKVTGVKYLQPRHLVTISGLHEGMKINIPGQEITQAVNKYWKHGLFSDVKIIVTKIEDGKAYLEIQLVEQPRMGNLEITGINKTETGDIEEKINLRRGIQVTEDILNKTSHIIKEHFREKGFFNVNVDIRQLPDTSSIHLVNLNIDIDKGKRVKIQEIEFEGNIAFTDKRLRRVFKKTKQRDLNIFKGSKYIEDEYKEDKKKLIEFYNERGYRDAKILNEELVHLNKKRVALKLDLHEGNQYYIRSIEWIGNTKYPTEYLNLVLGMKPGNLYDQKLLNERLSLDEDAITSVYMDNGYLFFHINPVEAVVENDSVDLELRIYEGKQATLNQILIRGNTKTNEHVVRRELYTRPGELFSRTDIIRSVREIATLGHFDPETISPNPLPNPSDGTVDIEYQLEERPNDQLELSGGWGGYYGFLGTIGIRFSNFSARRIFEKGAWRPVPSGDGQTLQVRAQASGRQYQGYNISFIEPWFGGKKPNSFSVSLYYSKRLPYASRYYNSFDEETRNSSFRTYGASIGLGKRLKWPDDYFSLYSELSYQQYLLTNYRLGVLTDGRYNLLSLKLVLSRSSQDQMIYPRRGSSFSIGVRVTPPYSLFEDKNYSEMEYSDIYRNIEFHKWTYSGKWFTSLMGNLVLAINTEFGYLGAYNKTIGTPPFEKFELGGDGLSGYDLYGTDVVALRGYENGSLTPIGTIEVDDDGELKTVTINDGNMYIRYYTELRYPLSLNPSATIYGLIFAEAGNAWAEWDNFNPFAVKRSAGIGLRAFLPMFGLLGVDVGYGFDKVRGTVSGFQWHFVLGQQL
ncbi:MAG: outer membrane protein assembly factor BamA [Bacteroidales bacterium]|nr:outer membrane protein assembly factor BamA [Bacteroidales bacterium]